MQAPLKPDLLMWAIAAMMVTFIWRVQDFSPILAKLRLVILAAILGGAVFLNDKHPFRRISQLRRPLLVITAGILVAGMLGIPTAIVASRAAISLLTEGIPNWAFMVMVACSIRSLRDIEWYALMSLLGAVVYAISVVLFFPPTPDGRLGALVYYDANEFALLLVCHIPFAVYLLRSSATLRQKAIGAFSMAVLALVVMKSGSRGGFVGFLIVMTYVLLRYRGVPARTRLLAVVGGGIVLLLTASDSYWTRMRTLLEPEKDYNYSGQSETGRMEIWKRGVGYMKSSPLLGVGLRGFPVAEGYSAPARAHAIQEQGFKWSVAHNAYVEVGAEIGFPGLVLFIASLITGIVMMARIRPGAAPPGTGPPRDVPLAQMILGSLFGFMVVSTFVSSEQFAFLYLLFGLVLGHRKVTDWLQRARPTGPVPARAGTGPARFGARMPPPPPVRRPAV